MDRFDAMQVLLTVVDQGSLSAGSRSLHTPLASVSRKVAELERHLGSQLLIRTSRHVQLTDAGRDYVDAARLIVAQIEDAERRVSGEYDVPCGELRITVPDDFGRGIVFPLLHAFLHEQPEITIDIITANRFVDLIEERIDVGIRIGQLADSSLYAVKVGEARLRTCASPAYLERMGAPTIRADLAGHSGVQLGDFERAWIYGDATAPDAEPVRRVRANDASGACSAAIAGLGITRLPDFIVDAHLRSGALVEILPDYPSIPMPIHILYNKQGLLPLKVRAFIDWMAPRLRRRLLEINRGA